MFSLKGLFLVINMKKTVGASAAFFTRYRIEYDVLNSIPLYYTSSPYKGSTVPSLAFLISTSQFGNKSAS